MNYFEAFEKVKKALSDAHVTNTEPPFAAQVRLCGESSGTLYILFTDGRAFAEPYDYYDNDADISVDLDTLLSIIEHKIDIEEAVSDGLMSVCGNKERLAELFAQLKIRKKCAPKKAKASKKKTEGITVDDKKKPQTEDVIEEVVKTETKPEK